LNFPSKWRWPPFYTALERQLKNFPNKIEKEMSRVEGRGRAKKENENFKGG
jgi:hypothetical protein